MKRIVDHRCTQKESNLVACHSDFDLVEIFLLDQVALRNAGSVYTSAG